MTILFTISTPIIVAIAGGVVLLLAVASGRAILRARRRARTARHLGADLSIDVASLKVEGVPTVGPRLEFYGVPVRLVVLVLAPAGRGTDIPPPDRLRTTVEEIAPGLAGVLDSHQPIFRRWPEQFSTNGFAQQFFTNIQLPGDRGKGTPWCSVAGRFEIGGGQLMAGLVCLAARPNMVAQVIVERAGLWHDVLRVRSEQA